MTENNDNKIMAILFIAYLVVYSVLLLTGVIGLPYMSVDTFEIEMTYTDWRTNEYCKYGTNVVFANTPLVFEFGNLSGDYWLVQKKANKNELDMLAFINTTSKVIYIEIDGRDISLFKVYEKSWETVIFLEFIPGYS